MLTTRTLPNPVIVATITSLSTQSGLIKVGSTNYNFPLSDGSSGAQLTTTGTGQLIWTTPAASDINVFSPITVSAAIYQVAATDTLIKYTGLADAIFTLPTAASRPGKQLLIQNNTTYILTIKPANGDIIDGDSSTIQLDSIYSAVMAISDGQQNWSLI